MANYNDKNVGKTQAPTNGLEELFEITELDEGNLQLPSVYTCNMWREKKERLIWLCHEVDEQILEYTKMIIQWNREDDLEGLAKEDRQPIVIVIATPGGLLMETLGMVDVCRISRTPIYTVNLAYAYSAGAILFLMGEKRFALPHSQILFHNGSGGIGASYSEAQSANESWKRLVKQMQEYILERTNIPKSTLTKKLKAGDWYLGIEDMLSMGIATDTLEDMSVLMNLVNSKTAKKAKGTKVDTKVTDKVEAKVDAKVEAKVETKTELL